MAANAIVQSSDATCCIDGGSMPGPGSSLSLIVMNSGAALPLSTSLARGRCCCSAVVATPFVSSAATTVGGAASSRWPTTEATHRENRGARAGCLALHCILGVLDVLVCGSL